MQNTRQCGIVKRQSSLKWILSKKNLQTNLLSQKLLLMKEREREKDSRDIFFPHFERETEIASPDL